MVGQQGQLRSGTDGLDVDVLAQAVINVTYTVGEEKLVFVGFDFLF